MACMLVAQQWWTTALLSWNLTSPETNNIYCSSAHQNTNSSST